MWLLCLLYQQGWPQLDGEVRLNESHPWILGEPILEYQASLQKLIWMLLYIHVCVIDFELMIFQQLKWRSNMVLRDSLVTSCPMEETSPFSCWENGMITLSYLNMSFIAESFMLKLSIPQSDAGCWGVSGVCDNKPNRELCDIKSSDINVR